MKPSLGWMYLVVCCVLPQTVFSDAVQVGVRSLGANTSRVTLSTDVQAKQKSLWARLTDYDHQAGYLPYMTKSRVVGHEAANILVEQEGTIRILFWSFTMRMMQRVSEEPPRHMHFRAVEGDFTRLEGDFALDPKPLNPSVTHLECHFTVKPKRRVPDWAVRMAAKRYLRKMVRALAEKAEGRGS